MFQYSAGGDQIIKIEKRKDEHANHEANQNKHRQPDAPRFVQRLDLRQHVNDCRSREPTPSSSAIESRIKVRHFPLMNSLFINPHYTNDSYSHYICVARIYLNFSYSKSAASLGPSHCEINFEYSSAFRLASSLCNRNAIASCTFLEGFFDFGF